MTTSVFSTDAPIAGQWAQYLFSNGSMIGMNADILCQYIEYIANVRMSALG